MLRSRGLKTAAAGWAGESTQTVNEWKETEDCGERKLLYSEVEKEEQELRTALGVVVKNNRPDSWTLLNSLSLLCSGHEQIRSLWWGTTSRTSWTLFIFTTNHQGFIVTDHLGGHQDVNTCGCKSSGRRCTHPIMQSHEVMMKTTSSKGGSSLVQPKFH